MNKRMKLLLVILGILAAANVVKTFHEAGLRQSDSKKWKLPAGLAVSVPLKPLPGSAAVHREIFSGPYQAPQAVKESKPALPENTAAEAVKWPDFRISGTAVSGGRNMVFFSGRAFKGMVYEGDAIAETFVLSAVSGGKAEITERVTGEKRMFDLEGR